MDKNSFYIGIDEAGRGPLAGPVAVGLVALRERKPVLPFFKKIKDSKKLSAQKRREIFKNIIAMSDRGQIIYAVSFVGPRLIDKIGIVRATHIGINRCLKKAGILPGNSHVLLDGGLKAPKSYLNQETIIKGDEKEYLIALASIVAKVLRDAKMERMGMRYPVYGFGQHKGYGTKSHFKKIKKYGAVTVHRKTFIS